MNTLLSTVAQALQGQQHVLLAFSGGLDSSVLLHLLLQLHQQGQLRHLRACHIHHGLSTQADHWAQFCLERCQDLSITYSMMPVCVVQKPRVSLEDAARQARYVALAEQLQPGEVLVTAHHVEDQCETFLLALKRGSGPAGLSAMAPCKPFASSMLYRPLLSVSRTALVQYAQRHALTWVEDESNQALQFDRNFLRQVIVPQLTARWPAFVANTVRSAQLCAEQEQLLEQLLQTPLQQMLNAEQGLSIVALNVCSVIHRNALLRRWCRLKGAPIPSRQALMQLWQTVALSRQDANPCLRLGFWQVRRFRQYLYLLPPQKPLPDQLCWDLKADLVLPQDLGVLKIGQQGESSAVRAPTADQRVTIRFGLQGRIRIAQRGGRRVKKCYQEQHIPPWLRARLPVLSYDEQVIAIPGIAITEAGAPQTGQPVLHLVWQR